MSNPHCLICHMHRCSQVSGSYGTGFAIRGSMSKGGYATTAGWGTALVGTRDCGPFGVTATCRRLDICRAPAKGQLDPKPFHPETLSTLNPIRNYI